METYIYITGARDSEAARSPHWLLVVQLPHLMEEPVPGGVRVADPFQLCERVRQCVGDEGQWGVQLIELIVTHVGLAEDGRPALPGVADDTKYCSRCRWIVQDG
jgi:hypothetical protein